MFLDHRQDGHLTCRYSGHKYQNLSFQDLYCESSCWDLFRHDGAEGGPGRHYGGMNMQEAPRPEGMRFSPFINFRSIFLSLICI